MANAGNMEKILLRLENDASISFKGRLFSEAVWYDEDSGVLTHQKLYVTDQNEHIYELEKRRGEQRICRAYRIAVHGERCVFFNGKSSLELPLDMLILTIRSLCGSEDGIALAQVEEILRAANC
jgi:hypothetical protein